MPASFIEQSETPLSFKPPTSISKSKWATGLSTLNRLWKRGLFPEDLDRHYFLHWFVIYNGNIIKTAEALQIHRNTIQGHFLALGYSNKSVRLRHAWQKLNENPKSGSFEKKFHSFYQKFGKKPSFSAEENAGLVGLWQVKFPFKTLTPHYFLWAVRANKSKDWVQKELGYSYRHRARLMNPLLKPKTRDGFWLSPLKPLLKEVYSPRYRTILARNKR
ncbi:MAG TPA: hypothetical protein VMV05_07665 [bacterium]|nr:hypothetical protein [bacterium]